MTKEIKPRESVMWFAEQMELKLRENDHKGGWEDASVDYLSVRLLEEVAELCMAIHRRGMIKNNPGIKKEAADVANFAMMIAELSK